MRARLRLAAHTCRVRNLRRLCLMSERSGPFIPERTANFPCPKCGSAVVRRIAKRGNNATTEFWGCLTFPKCRSIMPIEESEPAAPEMDVVDAVCPFSSPPPRPPTTGC